jgi:hypothetical protein
VAPDVVQTTAVIPNVAPKVASALKEPEDGLLSKVVSAPLSVAIGKGNVEMSSSSGDDSSGSDSEDSDSGSGSSSNTSSSSHVGKPVKPSFPVGVGTAVVSTANLLVLCLPHQLLLLNSLVLSFLQHLFLKVLQKSLCRRLMVVVFLMKLTMRQWMRASWMLPMIFLRKRRKMMALKSRIHGYPGFWNNISCWAW